jgi:saccharopine dehydrogenase-like NADP-dependent oxidoreductase
MRFLIGLGFADKKKIDVRTHLTYRDVLIRRLRNKLGGDYADAVLMRVLISGKKDGASRTLAYEMIELFDESSGLTAIQRTTSIPTATVACLVGSGRLAGGGAAPAENVVDGDSFCQLLEERGLKITTRWFDGVVPVESQELVA